MEKKMSRLILGGYGYKSYYQKESTEGEAVKRLTIEMYQAFFVDGKNNSVISEKTDDKVIVEYKDDHVVGIFRQVTHDDEKILEPFFGVFCIVWFTKRKSNGKIHFLWTNMQEDDYQYMELSCLGIESQIVIALCKQLFSSLKTLIPKESFEELEMLEMTNPYCKLSLEEENNA